MITDVLFGFATGVLSWLAGLMPTGTITLPSSTAVATWLGTYAGPFDKVLPLAEASTFAVVLLTVWVPSALTYQLVVWAYKHLPFLGRG